MKMQMENNKEGNIRGLMKQEAQTQKEISRFSEIAYILFFLLGSSGSAIAVGHIHVILQCAVRRKSSIDITLYWEIWDVMQSTECWWTPVVD